MVPVRHWDSSRPASAARRAYRRRTCSRRMWPPVPGWVAASGSGTSAGPPVRTVSVEQEMRKKQR